MLVLVGARFDNFFPQLPSFRDIFARCQGCNAPQRNSASVEAHGRNAAERPLAARVPLRRCPDYSTPPHSLAPPRESVDRFAQLLATGRRGGAGGRGREGREW